jgi:hypothetical protein
MFHVFKNILVVFVVVLVVVNVSLLNTPLVDDAIQNLLLFTAWAFTMRYMVDPERVSWILLLYSSCILALLMFHTLVSWASVHGFIDTLSDALSFPDAFSDAFSDAYKLQDWARGGLNNALLWFDTLAFFFVVYLVEHRENDVDIERVRA